MPPTYRTKRDFAAYLGLVATSMVPLWGILTFVVHTDPVDPWGPILALVGTAIAIVLLLFVLLPWLDRRIARRGLS